MTVLIANIIDTFVAFIQIGSGTLKKKSQILLVLIFQQFLQAVSMLLLGGVMGAANNVISCIRNYLCYKEKMTNVWKVVLIAGYVLLTAFLNEEGFWGLIPATANTVYLLFMNVKDPIKFKLLGVCIIMPWIVYNLIIQAYVGAICNTAAVITNVITVCVMLKERKNAQAKTSA